MKKIIFIFLLALSAQTHGLELADVKLDENIQLEKQLGAQTSAVQNQIAAAKMYAVHQMHA